MTCSSEKNSLRIRQLRRLEALSGLSIIPSHHPFQNLLQIVR
jgi:hypothetical protein